MDSNGLKNGGKGKPRWLPPGWKFGYYDRDEDKESVVGLPPGWKIFDYYVSDDLLATRFPRANVDWLTIDIVSAMPYLWIVVREMVLAELDREMPMTVRFYGEDDDSRIKHSGRHVIEKSFQRESVYKLKTSGLYRTADGLEVDADTLRLHDLLAIIDSELSVFGESWILKELCV